MRRRRAASFLCLLGALSFAALACEPSDPSPVGRGRGTFKRTCSGCHGADGRGTMRPGLTRPPRDLTNPTFQAQMSDEQLRQSIRIGKGQMPAFGGLMSDEEISNLIVFIRSLVPPGTVLPGAAGAPSSARAPAAAPSPAAAPLPAPSPGAAVTARGASTP